MADEGRWTESEWSARAAELRERVNADQVRRGEIDEAAEEIKDDPETNDRRAFRIEALRAAGPIVANLQPSYQAGTKFALDMAAKFARWLEAGER